MMKQKKKHIDIKTKRLKDRQRDKKTDRETKGQIDSQRHR